MNAMLRAGLLAALLLGPSFAASAAEKLRVGKAVPEAFSFVPVDIGIRKGIFARHGLELESISFAGDARMQQAAAADSIDILLGSGPAMAFIAKGAPIKAVAAMAARRSSSLSSSARTDRRPRPTSRTRRSASRPQARSPTGS
jgi:ABC-type nitrate/sulfonate/bicarbonate transport system substrate-binding protein